MKSFKITFVLDDITEIIELDEVMTSIDKKTAINEFRKKFIDSNIIKVIEI